MGAKADADHAADTVTYIPITGFLVYFNITPIYWNLKKKSVK